MTNPTPPDLELAGVRALTSLRELTYVSDGHTIRIEVHPRARTVQISGTVDPPDATRVQLLVGGVMFAADVDGTGGFVIGGVDHGTVLPFVDLPDGRIRLGSFEV
ncbi:MAG: hypothetical protein ACK5PP_08720 [Acidimicrobiales bacterium]